MENIMLDRAGVTMKHILCVLGVLYVIAVQLPLFSAYRPVIVDELLIADSTYAMASGETKVPALKAWEHIIPAFGTINFHYPPAYLYLSALTFKILGFGIASMGTLHAILRLLSALCFFLLAKTCRYSTLGSIALTAVWATFCHGPVGRPEDLAILFLILGVLLLSGQGQNRYHILIAGICFGMALLTHPTAVITIVPIAVIALWVKHPEQPKRLMIKFSALVAIMGTISLLWLFWIIPYWPEFKAIFLNFVLPDAATSSYKSGLVELVHDAVSGKWAGWAFPEMVHLFRFQYSLVPVALLIIFIAVYKVKNRLYGIIIALSIGIVPLLAARNHYLSYYMTWVNVYLVTLLGLLGTGTMLKEHWIGGTNRIVLGLLVSLIAVQVSGDAAGQVWRTVGDIRLQRLCHPYPHFAALASIPPHEKVLLNDGYIFYHIRSKDPVYWPAGLEGRTRRGVPFKTEYDPSFRWMILDKPLSESKNPGLKFGWDLKSRRWFRENYVLYKVSTINNSLDRYYRTRFPKALYIYLRKATSGKSRRQR